MKKLLPLILLTAGLFLSAATNAQTLVHYWNFNNIPDVDVHVPTTVVNSTYSRIDTTKATVWYTTVPGTSSAYDSYFDIYSASDSTMGVGQNWNARFGDCACNAYRTRNPSDSMELLAFMPTTHYQNPIIKFVTETSSASGMQVQAYDYSTDSGATWKTTGISMTVDSPVSLTWASVTINLNSTTDTTIRNNPRLVFRTLYRVNTIGTTGNNRMDNLTMEADTLTVHGVGVATITAEENAYTLYPNPVTNTLTIGSDADGAKSVMIRGMDGKTVFAGLLSGKHAPLDVANLVSGTYFVTVKEISSGNTSTMKFIKQ